MTTLREEFEAHIVAEGYDGGHWLQRWRVGDAANKERYMKDWVQTAWEAYQAATERAAKVVEDTDTVEVSGPNSMYCQLGDAAATRAACAAAIRAQAGGDHETS